MFDVFWVSRGVVGGDDGAHGVAHQAQFPLGSKAVKPPSLEALDEVIDRLRLSLWRETALGSPAHARPAPIHEVRATDRAQIPSLLKETAPAVREAVHEHEVHPAAVRTVDRHAVHDVVRVVAAHGGVVRAPLQTLTRRMGEGRGAARVNLRSWRARGEARASFTTLHCPNAPCS